MKKMKIGFVKKEAFEGITKEVNFLWDDLIRKGYIAKNGAIYNSFRQLKNASSMRLNHRFIPLKNTVFEILSQSRTDKISTTGNSYKIKFDETKNRIYLAKTKNKNDLKALSVVTQGANLYCCPICEHLDCITDLNTSLKLLPFGGLNIDLKRGLSRELRLCRNSKINVESVNIIAKRLPENKAALHNILKNQHNYFYIIEHKSCVIVEPQSIVEVNCPSCSSHKIREAIRNYQENKEEFELGLLKCPECQANYAMSTRSSALEFIISELIKRPPSPPFIISLEEKINHIFICYPFSTTTKIRDLKRRCVFNYPIQYMKLENSLEMKDIYNLFTKQGDGGKLNTRLDAHLVPDNIFMDFFEEDDDKQASCSIKDVVHFCKTEVQSDSNKNNILILMVDSPHFQKIEFLTMQNKMFRNLVLDKQVSWLDCWENLFDYLFKDNTKELEAAIFSYITFTHPSEINSQKTWRKTGRWFNITQSELILYPIKV